MMVMQRGDCDLVMHCVCCFENDQHFRCCRAYSMHVHGWQQHMHGETSKIGSSDLTWTSCWSFRCSALQHKQVLCDKYVC